MKCLFVSLILLTFTLVPNLQSASVDVALAITPSGSTFQYSATVQNNTAIDLAIVSLTDAPPNDPLIAGSLSRPPGYLGLYDAGLGIIDFVEDTLTFPAGLSVGPFTFESAADPANFFNTFTSIDIEGNIFDGLLTVTGRTPPTTTPDGGSTVVLSLLGVCLLSLLRKYRS